LLLTNIKRDVKEYGFATYSIYIIGKLLQSVSVKVSIEHFHIFVIPVDNATKIKVPKSIRNSYKIEVLYEYDPILKYFEISSGTIDFRFNQNAVCFLVIKNNEPCGYMWLIRKKYSEDVVFCDFFMSPEVAWDFDVFILNKYRLTPAFAVLWDYAFDYLRNKKVKWVYSRISSINRSSVAVHRKFGGFILGDLLFVKIGSKQLCFDPIKHKISLHSATKRKRIVLVIPKETDS